MPARHNQRTVPTLGFERGLQQSGILRVAGLDEAGRGAWAGPVVAAAVILPLEQRDLLRALDGVCDSKALSPQKRAKYAVLIRSIARSVGVGAASAREVDLCGLLPATRSAMRRALSGLSVEPEYLLLDYLILPEIPIDQTALPKGDARVLSIAAASIIAKVSRDDLMRAIALVYPDYGFEQHKGYGTHAHRQALDRLGPTPIHRYSYKPVGQRTLGLLAEAGAFRVDYDEYPPAA